MRRRTPGDIVLWNAAVIDRREPEPVIRQCISVRDGRITEVRDAGAGSAPDEAIDVGGRFVTPGLIDAHLHLTNDPKMLGKLADLVVFDSNPLQDIETLTRPDQVWAVISNGSMVAGQAVDDGALRREAVGPRI